MTYQTYYMVRSRRGEDAQPIVTLESRATYENISREIDALDPLLGYAELEKQFPEAYQAAVEFLDMKRRAGENSEFHGPFRIHTAWMPTDEFLVEWYCHQIKPAITPAPPVKKQRRKQAPLTDQIKETPP